MKIRLPGRKRWISLGLLLGSLLLIYVFGTSTPLQLFDGDDDLLRQEPDAFVIDATYLVFNEQGRLRTRLHSERAVHYPATDQGHLTNPRLTVYPDTGSPWQISSSQGILHIPEDRVELVGFVTVTGEQPAGKPLRFDSPTLEYNDKTRFIRTDQPVIINSQFNQLSAVGMEFQIDQKILRLFSRVEGVYVNP